MDTPSRRSTLPFPDPRAARKAAATPADERREMLDCLTRQKAEAAERRALRLSQSARKPGKRAAGVFGAGVAPAQLSFDENLRMLETRTPAPTPAKATLPGRENRTNLGEAVRRAVEAKAEAAAPRAAPTPSRQQRELDSIRQQVLRARAAAAHAHATPGRARPAPRQAATARRAPRTPSCPGAYDSGDDLEMEDAAAPRFRVVAPASPVAAAAAATPAARRAMPGTPMADALRDKFATPAGRVQFRPRGLATPYPATPGGRAPVTAAPPCTPAAALAAAAASADGETLEEKLRNALAAFGAAMPRRPAATPLAAEPGRAVYCSPDSPENGTRLPLAELGAFSDDEEEGDAAAAAAAPEPPVEAQPEATVLDFGGADEDDEEEEAEAEEAPKPESEPLQELDDGPLLELGGGDDSFASAGDEAEDREVVSLLDDDEVELLQRAGELASAPAAAAAPVVVKAEPTAEEAAAARAEEAAAAAASLEAKKRSHMKLGAARRAASGKAGGAATAAPAPAAAAPPAPVRLGSTGSVVVLEAVPASTERTRKLGTPAFLSPVRRSSRKHRREELRQHEQEGVRAMLEGASTFLPNHALDVQPEETRRAVGSIAAVASGKVDEEEEEEDEAPAAAVEEEKKPASAASLLRALESLSLRGEEEKAARRCASCNGGGAVCAGPAGRNTLCRGCYDTIKESEAGGKGAGSPARSVRNGTPMLRRPRRAAAPLPAVVDADGFAVPALPARGPRRQAKSGKPAAAPLTPRRSARLARGQ